MAVALVLLGARVLIRHDKLDLKHPLTIMVGVYAAYAFLRFLFDFRQYKIDAIRDLAVVYYCAFFFIAYQLGSKPNSRAFLGKCFTVAVVFHAVIAVIFHVSPDFLMSSVVIRGAPLLMQKGDLTMTFSAVGMFFLVNRSSVGGMKWLRNLLLVILTASAALGIARAAILAILIVSMLLWVSGRRRAFFYPLVGLVGLTIVLLGLNATSSAISKSQQVVAFKEKMASMVDVTGKYRYKTELGVMKSDNNEFRRTFWRIIVKDTTANNPIFGRGFGYDFYPKFQAFYNRGFWEGLRSPHNYFVTVYGRMGAVGLLIFIGVTLVIISHAIKAARLVRAGRMAAPDFGYWCGAMVLLVSGTFGVVLEGPMGAIPFWTCLGLALSSPVLAAKPKAAVARPEPATFRNVPRTRREPVPAFASRRLAPGS
jgi:O-antigen ligase